MDNYTVSYDVNEASLHIDYRNEISYKDLMQSLQNLLQHKVYHPLSRMRLDFSQVHTLNVSFSQFTTYKKALAILGDFPNDKAAAFIPPEDSQLQYLFTGKIFCNSYYHEKYSNSAALQN